MKHESPLQVAAFFDTRPGHIKQTRGILAALDELTGVQVHEVMVPHLGLGGELGKWTGYLLGRGACAAPELAGSDLLIGTGSRTHIPLLNCKRRYDRPAVTCMTPARLLLNHFDLCFIPRHDRPDPGNNIFVTDGPPNLARAAGRHETDRGLILVGGKDDKSHRWDSAALVRSVSLLLEQEPATRWLITTSPRTPQETSVQLGDLAARHDHASFVDFKHTGAGWIEEEYDRNRTVWVTADSMSMVFEALSAGCRVGLLPVAWRQNDGKFQVCEDYLAKKGYIVTFEQWQNGEASWALSRPLNEARRCAEEILRRWWPDRLR